MMRTSCTPPVGTVTFLFTDVEGSMVLWEADSAAMSRAQARHDEILREAFETCGGYVFSIAGDGYGAAFPAAGRALDAAVRVQRAMAAEAWPRGAEIRVRVGVHTGEAEERAGNYFGPAVNYAARLMGAARGGQLLVSAVTAAILGSRDDVDLRDLGRTALTGVAAPVQVFCVVGPGCSVPELPVSTGRGGPGNLSRPLCAFVGDEGLVDRLAEQVGRGGLTTLAGPGGVGKSRLALEVAWRASESLPDGAWWVELAPVPDGADPVQAIASTLSIQHQPRLSASDVVVDWCFGRRMLLVLDNCEHVRGPTAALAAAIAARCPSVAVVATSQVPLGVPGERVEHVVGLAPRRGVELFRARAGAAEGDRATVESICRRLDGLPLAIELAAARARLLGAAVVLDRLDDRLRLLRSTSPLSDPRHRTLRGALDWSYGLLSAEQQRCLDRLSVFAGTFDLAAVTALNREAGEAPDEFDTIDRLADLVEKSMVTAVRHDGTTRYRLLETLRQYAAEGLERRGETTSMRERHLDHYLGVAARRHDQWLSPDQPLADRAFDQEWDNLRAAHRWAVQTGRAAAAQDLVVATAWHALERLRHEHRSWAESALAAASVRGGTHPTTYAVLAAWAYFAAELSTSIGYAEEAVERHRDHPAIAGALAWWLYALLGADLVDEAAAVVPLLTGQLDRDLALDVEFMARMALTDASLEAASDAHDLAFAALCRRIGSPVALARAAQLRASRLLAQDPPDVAAALDGYRSSLAAGGPHAPSERVWSLCGVATCRVLADAPDAPAALCVAIEASHDDRLWFALDLALGTSASYLLARSPQAAATILGHVLTRPPSAIGAATAACRAALAEVRTWDSGQVWMNLGAATGRHEIVPYALEALREADDQEPSP